MNSFLKCPLLCFSHLLSKKLPLFREMCFQMTAARPLKYMNSFEGQHNNTLREVQRLKFRLILLYNGFTLHSSSS